jgi:hypothetical protein
MRLSVLPLAATLLIGLDADARAQILTGRVIELDSEQPIVAASIGIFRADQPIISTISDTTGHFRLVLPEPGWYRIRVERLGYAPAETDTLQFVTTELVDVSISLRVNAVQLTPLMVITRQPAGPWAEFERRVEEGRRTGNGRFFTRPQLDSTMAMTVTSLLSRVSLVGMSYDNRGRATPVMLGRGGCAPSLYLNGARMNFAFGESIDDLLDPGSLEGVEIYRHRMEVPLEYAGPRECGAILFWTRMGERHTGVRWWRYLVAGGALLGLHLAFRAF